MVGFVGEWAPARAFLPSASSPGVKRQLLIKAIGEDELLEQLRQEQRTMIFYEAPHKLCSTLADMAAVFGGDRSLSLCRELTKIHEEVRLTTFADAIAYYENTPPRGEFVLVVAGAVPQQEAQLTLEEAAERVRQYVADGQKLTQACKTVAAETGHRKSDLYDAVQKD